MIIRAAPAPKAIQKNEPSRFRYVNFTQRLLTLLRCSIFLFASAQEQTQCGAGNAPRGMLSIQRQPEKETMKRFIALTATALCFTAAAYAEPSVTVPVPADLSTPETVESYTESLDKAVEKVCRRSVRDIFGANYYAYLSCIDATELQVAAKDPTGLYAAAKGKSPESLTVAIR
jgi:UrcA family protein